MNITWRLDRAIPAKFLKTKPMRQTALHGTEANGRQTIEKKRGENSKINKGI